MGKSVMRVLMTALAGAAIAGGTAQAQDSPRIGVVTGVHVNVPDEDAVEISRALGEALQQELVVETVAGKDAEAALEPEGVPEGCITDSACLEELRGRLGTDQILVLVVLRVGDRYRIEATWSAEGVEPVDRPPISLNQGIEHAPSIFADKATRLLPDAERRHVKAVADVEPEGGGSEGLEGPESGGGSTAGGFGGSGTGGVGSAPPQVDRPRGRHMTAGAWTALLVGGGVAAVAGTVGLVQDRRNPSGDRDTLNLTLDIIGFSAVGLGVVTAGILYYNSGSEEPASRATVQVGSGPGDVGVSLGGAF